MDCDEIQGRGHEFRNCSAGVTSAARFILPHVKNTRFIERRDLLG